MLDSKNKTDVLLALLVVIVISIAFMCFPDADNPFSEPDYVFTETPSFSVTECVMVRDGKPVHEFGGQLTNARWAVIKSVEPQSITKLPTSATITPLTKTNYDSFIQVSGRHRTVTAMVPTKYKAVNDLPNAFHNTTRTKVYLLISA